MASEDVRTRLLKAAGPVFADKGYQAATVRDICAAAGANVAGVNYHFGDKETLYVETVKLARQLRADRFPMPDWPPGTPADARLSGFVTTLLMRLMAVDEVSWNTRLMLREVIEPSGVCVQLVRDYIRPMFEILLDIVSELLPDTAPDHLRHKIAFSILGQCLYYRVAEQIIASLIPEEERLEQFQPQQLAEHIVQFSLSAFGTLPPLGRDTHSQEASTPRT